MTTFRSVLPWLFGALIVVLLGLRAPYLKKR